MINNNILRRPFKYSFNNTCLIIIGINIAFFIFLRINPNLMSYFSLNVRNIIMGHMYYEFITYMFVHDLYNYTHIIFNMLGLLFFGVAVEKAIGSKEFILLYLLSGIFCGIVSFLVYYFTGAYYVFLLGASGAVYAILLAYAVIFPKSKIFIWGILPIPAPILVAIYAGIEIFSQIFNARTGVAHMTHLAGFLFSWLYFIIRMGINPWKIWKDAYK